MMDGNTSHGSSSMRVPPTELTCGGFAILLRKPGSADLHPGRHQYAMQFAALWLLYRLPMCTQIAHLYLIDCRQLFCLNIEFDLCRIRYEQAK